MTLEELNVIEQHIFAKADNKYVHIDDCNTIQTENNKKFSNDDTRIKLFEQKMKSWEWLFKLIATGTIGTLLTSILSLVLK